MPHMIQSKRQDPWEHILDQHPGDVASHLRRGILFGTRYRIQQGLQDRRRFHRKSGSNQIRGYPR